MEAMARRQDHCTRKKQKKEKKEREKEQEKEKEREKEDEGSHQNHGDSEQTVAAMGDTRSRQSDQEGRSRQAGGS